jgi:acetyl-CoA decarbonylase/synthase complex subunit gamma
MALSGVEIFKHLPKTNCKKCGHPTCLAFAMKLAAKQASLDACPDASDDAKKILGEAAAPPIRAVTLGTGAKAVKVGDEICMFRHEKKFFNPNVFAVAIKAFGDRNYGTAVHELRRVRNIAHRFGGSHAQRDVLDLTLIEEAFRSGNRRFAAALAAERSEVKPSSPLARLFVERASTAKLAA